MGNWLNIATPLITDRSFLVLKKSSTIRDEKANFIPTLAGDGAPACPDYARQKGGMVSLLRLLSVFRRIPLLTAFVAAFFLYATNAQKNPEPSPPKYDSRTEMKMKATVEEVKLPIKGSAKEVVHLIAKNGTDTADVYLCPKSFLDDMGVTFNKGDEIALIGSKVNQGEAKLILAREVVKGADTLVLRDEKGSPVWNWRH